MKKSSFFKRLLLVLVFLSISTNVYASGFWGAATATPASSLVLPNRYMFIGNASGAANAVPLSGDTTISVTGEMHIVAGGVASNEIQDRSVWSIDIGTGAVEQINMKSNSVASAEIQDKSIWAIDIATNVITSNEIDANAVGSSEIINEAVNSSKIQDRSIVAVDINTASVTANEILDETIVSADIFNRTILAVDIGTSAITSNELGAGSVGSTQVTDESLSTNDIANRTIAAIDINTGVITANEIAAGVLDSELGIGDVKNCGLRIDGTTLSITADDQTALSSTNKCLVGYNKGSGKAETATFSSPISVTFGGTSDTDGNTFSVLATRDWGTMPLVLSVLWDATSTNTYFTLGRWPQQKTDSAATGVCRPGDVDCDGLTDVMVLSASATLTDLTSRQLTPVAWFVGSYSATGLAWTYTLPAHSGFNKNWAQDIYSIPVGQPAAQTATSHLSIASGGTSIPEWTNPTTHKYTISTDYMITEYFSTTSAGTCTNGVSSQVILLKAIQTPNTTYRDSCGWYQAAGVAGNAICLNDGSLTGYYKIQTSVGAGLAGNSFSNIGDDIDITVQYKP
jgi:hypothetical protein